MSFVTSETPALERALGARANAVLASDAHAVDGMTPRLAVTPPNADELAAALRIANEHGAAVIPWGGGRHMSLGNAPARYDVALVTQALDRTIEYEPADLTVTVEAGMRLDVLRTKLAEQGQFLPIDAPADASVGGVLAANVSGPSRHAYGLPRDWLIGCRVAHPDGSISKGGGRVVKNVAGYDMPRLYVGSLGTLGVIVEATFKLAPLPPVQETLVAVFPTLDAASEAVFAADDRGLALRGVALRQRATEPGAGAAFWLAGTRAAVERTRRELTELCGRAETEELHDDASDAFWNPPAGVDAEESWVWPPLDGVARAEIKGSLPPSAVQDYLRALDRRVAVTVAYPTTGMVLSSLRDPDPAAQAGAIEDARRDAERLGGSLVVTSAEAEVKRRIDVWGDLPAEALAVMRRLKQQFDPKASLGPGRFVGGL